MHVARGHEEHVPERCRSVSTVATFLSPLVLRLSLRRIIRAHRPFLFVIQTIKRAQQPREVFKAAQGAVKESLERGVVLGLLERELQVGRHGEGRCAAGVFSRLHVSRTTIRLVLRGRTSRGVSHLSCYVDQYSSPGGIPHRHWSILSTR